MNNNKLFVQGALLLATVLVIQSLRFVLPMPPIMSMFIIGTLVNAALFIATLTTNIKIASLICTIAPVVAFMQGQLPVAPLILVVATANLAYITTIYLTHNKKRWLSIVCSALCKMFFMLAGLELLLKIIKLPDTVVFSLQMAFSLPQLFTAGVGTALGYFLLKRLHINT